MLYWLADFSGTLSVLNVFRYLTVRTGGAMITALVFVFLFGPWIIDHLRLRQGKGQPIRADGPQSHLIAKTGTPTMGGLMILLGIVVSTVLWANPRNPYVWIVLAVTLGFGLVGFYDDYLKVTQADPRRLRRHARGSLIEALIALAACFAIASLGRPPFATSLAFPFFKELVDQSRLVLRRLRRLHHRRRRQRGEPDRRARRACHRPGDDRGGELRRHLLSRRQRGVRRLSADPFRAGTGELAVLCGAVIGAGLGFLWFNAPPASIFMGDTGSLALGGLIGTVAVATKHEIVLAIIGGLFVLEAVSVIVQVVSFKLTGKRVFRMAPIHHHFEQLGWTEPQIVIRFWIISIVLALAGLADARSCDDPGHQLSPARRSRCSGSAARGLRARRR